MWWARKKPSTSIKINPLSFYEDRDWQYETLINAYVPQPSKEELMLFSFKVLLRFSCVVPWFPRLSPCFFDNCCGEQWSIKQDKHSLQMGKSNNTHKKRRALYVGHHNLMDSGQNTMWSAFWSNTLPPRKENGNSNLPQSWLAKFSHFAMLGFWDRN